MKIPLNLEKGRLKQEVIFETTPDDHVLIHEYNLALVDVEIDKEYRQTIPEWKITKLDRCKAMFFNHVIGPHMPIGGWTLNDYSRLDYP